MEITMQKKTLLMSSCVRDQPWMATKAKRTLIVAILAIGEKVSK